MDYRDKPPKNETGSRFNRRHRAKWGRIQPALTGWFALVAAGSGIEVSAHDLRRTFITAAESADLSETALKALVNHSLGRSVTAGYIQVTGERLRGPVQRVADKLKALCGVTDDNGVVELRRRPA